MYAITGMIGTFGGELARNGLAAGPPARAGGRNGGKDEAWVALGCQIVLAHPAPGPSRGLRGVRRVLQW
jgi:hypothetical protein